MGLVACQTSPAPAGLDDSPQLPSLRIEGGGFKDWRSLVFGAVDIEQPHHC